MRRRIDPAVRRHQDYLRLKALKAAKIYEARLRRFRRAEVRRVLSLCRDYDPAEWAGIIDSSLAEPYLQTIESGLLKAVGLPHAKSVVRDMNKAKAEASEVLESMWLSGIEQYANERVGDMIVSVTGTLKDDLVKILQAKMADEVTGIEKLTLDVFAGYKELELWQVRRIIQTETMIGLGKAGDMAARTLDVKFTKQWSISGLGNTRETHIEVDGTIVGQEEPFKVGRSYLLYPHDISLGAEAGEIINCACYFHNQFLCFFVCCGSLEFTARGSLNINVYMCLFKSLPFIELISSRNVIAKWKFNSKTTPAASR